jgi:hypothetical protein
MGRYKHMDGRVIEERILGLRRQGRNVVCMKIPGGCYVRDEFEKIIRCLQRRGQ